MKHNTRKSPEEGLDQIKKSIMVEIVKEGIEFAKGFRDNIGLYKQAEQQSAVSNLTQKYLITFYNMLAAYYLKCSELQSSEVRDELNMEANQYINKAMDISYQEASTCIIRGYSSIISGQLAQAEQEFDHVLHQKNHDTLSLLGKAVVNFSKEQYKAVNHPTIQYDKALSYYQKIIRANPLCSLSIYNASALCLFKLGNPTLAKSIYEKVLSKDPSNQGAL
jgi:tetratricopeptide (TPR) repeat protein